MNQYTGLAGFLDELHADERRRRDSARWADLDPSAPVGLYPCAVCHTGRVFRIGAACSACRACSDVQDRTTAMDLPLRTAAERGEEI